MMRESSRRRGRRQFFARWTTTLVAVVGLVLLAFPVGRAEEEEVGSLTSTPDDDEAADPETQERVGDVRFLREGDLDNSNIRLSTYSPPNWPNQTSFVVLSAPRSASTSLTHLLNHHPQIQMDGEAFHTKSVGASRFSNEWTLASRDANRTAAMREMFERTSPPAKFGAAARGFKLFSFQFAESELVALTRPKHVLKIVLRRHDTFAEYVSALRMRETGVALRPKAGSDAASATSIDAAVDVDWGSYERWRAEQVAWYDWCAAQATEHDHPESWLFLSTERLVADPHAVAAIYAHLDVPPGRDFQDNPYVDAPLDAKVANWDDIKDKVALEAAGPAESR